MNECRSVEIVCEHCGSVTGHAFLQGRLSREELERIAAFVLKTHQETFHRPYESADPAK